MESEVQFVTSTITRRLNHTSLSSHGPASSRIQSTRPLWRSGSPGTREESFAQETKMERNPLKLGLRVVKPVGLGLAVKTERGTLEEGRICMGLLGPSLLQLCIHHATMNLSYYARNLHLLPREITATLVEGFLWKLPSASLRELEIVCGYLPGLKKLRLTRVPGLNSRGIQHLSMMRNLLRLDLRGCSWLENLCFLPALKCLECLNLRDCSCLSAGSLSLIREVPRLKCLDVENVSALTDNVAARTLSESRFLQALNVSGTRVGDGLVEVLTYGSRLQNWVLSQQSDATIGDHNLVTQGGQYGIDALLQQWPVSSLTYLRLQRTHITHAAIAGLLAIPDLLLLDMRLTNVTGKSIFALQAKHKLVALPNNAKVAARTNTILAGVLEGECGCMAMARQSNPSNAGMATDEFMATWEQALIQLLQIASFGTPYCP